jgi:hypothetical protein
MNGYDLENQSRGGDRFLSLRPLGIVEHPINQVLKLGLSSNAFANEVV